MARIFKALSNKLKSMDGGFGSRKMWMSIGTSIAIFLSGCLAAWWPALVPALDTVVGGMIGCLALYLGSNVTTKWTLGKNATAKELPKEEII